ncbi:uncharacterized protein CXorf49 homolog [Mesocricetus auratus]|uniref:Uncharacterized protein CXorf49 homolog n=1 Tax=Mesocricetus auratus TaxID=10036 RepID=A0ABM2XE22_MESAU|nr:uncharacterized protein CXorf49 homolog [Mesocricetus auratus]
MNSNKEAAVEEVGLDPEDGEVTDVYVDIQCSLQNLDPDSYVGSSQSSLSEDEVENEDNSEFDSGSKIQVVESGVGVFQDHRKQSVSSVIDKGDVMDCLPLVNDKVKEMVQQSTNQMSQGARGHLSSKSCITKQSSPWADAEADHNRKSRMGKRLVDVKRASVAPLHHRGSKGGRACRTKKKKKSTKNKQIVLEDIPDPPLNRDTESDEEKEMQVMRVTICFKNGVQIISSNAMDPDDKNKKSNVQPRVDFNHMTLQMSAPMGTGKLGTSCSNRKATVFRGKEQSRPRYSGAAAGGLRKASSKKKLAQEKKPLQDAPRLTGRRPVPLWGQRHKAAPVETSTFPPITCVPTLESSKKYSTTPLEAVEPAHGTSRKKAVARNVREGLPAARGDRGLVCKDAVKNLTAMNPTSESYKAKEIPQAQLPTHRAEPPCSYHGDVTSGDPNLRAPQVPGNSQLVALSQRSARPRAPAPAGDQSSSVVPPLPVGEKHHQAPRTLGCQQCPLLEKEAHRLRKQLAIMQALNEKFQDR